MSGDIWYYRWNTRFQVGEQVRDVFEKTDSAVKSKNIKAYHWITTKHGEKRVIVKL